MKDFPEIVTNSLNSFAKSQQTISPYKMVGFFLQQVPRIEMGIITRPGNNASEERLKKLGLLSWKRGGTSL